MKLDEFTRTIKGIARPEHLALWEKVWTERFRPPIVQHASTKDMSPEEWMDAFEGYVSNVEAQQ